MGCSSAERCRRVDQRGVRVERPVGIEIVAVSRALRVLDRVRVPTLILTAGDDPFVPVAPFEDPAVTGNPDVRVIVTPHGGHCAYVERAASDYDGYWAEREIVRFIGSASRAAR